MQCSQNSILQNLQKSEASGLLLHRNLSNERNSNFKVLWNFNQLFLLRALGILFYPLLVCPQNEEDIKWRLNWVFDNWWISKGKEGRRKRWRETEAGTESRHSWNVDCRVIELWWRNQEIKTDFQNGLVLETLLFHLSLLCTLGMYF